MRRIALCSLVLIVCTTAVTAQVKISQVYGGGSNIGAPLNRDYVELYNTSAAPVLMTNWSVQYASSTGTFAVAATLNGTIPGNGYWLIGLAGSSTSATTLNAPGLPAVDSSGTTDMSATTGKVLLRSTSAAVTATSGQATIAAFPDIVDFVGYSNVATAANWNEPATTGAANTSANNAPTASATVAIYRNNCGASDTNVNKDDFAHGAPSPRNSLTAANLGLTVIGSVFPFTGRQGETVSLRCTPRLCATNTLNPGTTVTVDLTAFALGVMPMHDDGLSGDDLAGDGLYRLDVTVPAGQAAGLYNFTVFASDGANSGGAYLGMGVVASASTPANDNCAGAIALAVPSGPLAILMTGSNIESNPVLTSVTPPTTGFSSRRGLWYTVVGTGNTMTASTCSGPALDTVLMVFCGTCDSLSEVTSSDDVASTLCANTSSAVASWCSTAGQLYYVWVAPFATGASTATINLLISDNGTPCTGAMSCTNCPLAVAVPQSENEAGYGVATNDGCDSSPNLFTTIATPGFPGVTLRGTARGMGGNRDADWYRFQATATDFLSASITGQGQGMQLQLVSLAAGGVCPATNVTVSAITNRCGTAAIGAIVNAGTWYALRVITVGIEGSPPGSIFGGSIPGASSYNYTVTCDIGGPPINDNCANAVTVAIPSTTNAGTNAATTNDGTASCDPSGAAGKDVWFKVVTTAASTDLHVNTCGSAADTVLSVYSGACGSLTELGCNDDGPGCVCGAPASVLNVLGLAPGTYTIRVSTKAGTGAVVLNVKGITNDECCNAIAVACGSATPGTTVGASAETGLPVGCVGPQAPGLGQNYSYTNSVWYTVTAPPTGGTMYADTLATSYDSKIFVWTGACGAFTCVTANDDIIGSPFASKVAWRANPNQQYWLMIGPFTTTTGAFTLTVDCQATPANDDCVAPTLLAPAEGGAMPGTTIGATCSEVYTSTGSYPSCAATSPAIAGIFDVWYSYTACANTNVTFTTCGAYNTMLSVHTACPTLAGANNQVAGACNNDGPAGCTPGSSLTVAVTSGTTYLIRVAGAQGAQPHGNFTLTWAAAGPLWYLDGDGDGFGNPASSVVACLQPGGYVGNNQDCNDGNAAINPNATEVCDGIDNDCDNLVDDADSPVSGTTTFYQDSDGDGYGNPAMTQNKCVQPAGYVTNSLDCDDSNSAINPAATEICNGVDDDCDLLTDDADPGVTGQPTWYQDSDGDGYGNPAVTQVSCAQPSGYVANNGDCNDANTAVNPAATEICNNIDDDCDSIVDEVCPSNDHCATATVITDGTTLGDNTVAGSEIADLTCGPVAHDVWYSYTNPLSCTWNVTASLCPADGGGASFDAVIHVFSPPCGAPALIACNDNTCGTDPRVTFPLAGGATVLIAVSSVAPGPGGLFGMVLSHTSAAMSSIGPGCSDGGGPGPTLTLSALPVLCAPRTLNITGAAPSSAGMLMFSLPGTTTILTGGCPFYLNNGSLTFLFFIGTDIAGNWAAGVNVPCDPSLECATFYVQGFLFPNSPPPFYQVTSGLSVTLGY